MFTLLWSLFLFVVNGLFFVTVVAGLLFLVLWVNYYSPEGDTYPGMSAEAASAEAAEEEGKDVSDLLFPETPMSGQLTIRRQYAPNSFGSGGLFSSSPVIAEPTPEPGAPNDDNGGPRDRSENSSLHTNATINTTATTATYASRLSQTYRSMVEAKNARFPSGSKDTFYCVLKGRVLFIYGNESQTNCLAALGVDNYVVSIEKDDGPFDGKDGQMFTKRSAIVLRAKRREGVALPALTRGMQAEQGEEREIEMKPFYITVKPNTVMEDWYLALVQASGQATASSNIFDVKDMKNLVGTIDTEPDPIPMRWFNAIIGRIFFSLYQTEALEQFITAKIIKKTSKLPLPTAVGPITVKEVNVGNTAPYFSKPMLKELRADGTTSFEAHVSYRAKSNKPDSQLRITVATQITLPATSVRFNVVLAVVLKSLEGNVLIHMKKPPSNRIWWGFTTMPEMDMETKPIVGSLNFRQLAPAVGKIESLMREAIRDSVVLPNMDDLSIFDTSHLKVRGGVFDEAGKFKRTEEVQTETPPTVEIRATDELGTSNEDPSSAVPTTSTLRHRHRNRAQSTDLTNMDPRPSGDTEAVGLGISRTDTAPPTVGNGPTTKASVAVKATKRWFAQAGASRPPSLSTQTITGGLPNNSDPDMIRQRSTSSERRAVFATEPHSVDANLENDPVVAPVQVSSSSAGRAESERGSLAPTPSNESGLSTPGSGIHPHTLSAPTPPSLDQASDGRSSVETARATAIAPAQAHQSSASAIMNSLKSRDRRALQAQAGAARESLKKWSVGFAAKKRGGRESTHVQEEHRPPALYRPPEEDTREDDVPVVATSPNSGRSLQDRLNAAAHAGAAPLAIPARERSSSSGSRPNLFASPGKATASSVSSSPPNWTPSMSKPTTSVVKDEVTPQLSAHTTVPAPAPTSARRGSNSTPVLMQPAPGRSMVVPRVPKRPGQVTGIGHNANEPMVRRVSAEGEVKEERVANVGSEKKPPPVLPPRKSSEGLTPESISDKAGQAALDVSPPARSGTGTPEAAVPPPLPSRAKISPTPSSSNLTATKPASQRVPATEPGPSQQFDPVIVSATDNSGVTHSTEDNHSPNLTNLSSIDSPANDIVSNDKQDQLFPHHVQEPPLTPSGAENALRQLVAKNESVFNKRPRLSEGSEVESSGSNEANERTMVDGVSPNGKYSEKTVVEEA
ncbi:hypothetical protein IAT40_004022 [Kwoniella sp. CBS 6097]